MSWLNGNTTVKGLPSPDQEMLATFLKLNKIKPVKQDLQNSLKKSLAEFLIATPLLGRIYSFYKEKEIKNELLALEKLHLNQPIKDYQYVYLAAQKLFRANHNLQAIAHRFRSEARVYFQKKIEQLRISLIKQWRELTIQRFASGDKSLAMDSVQDSSTTQILSSLNKVKPASKKLMQKPTKKPVFDKSLTPLSSFRTNKNPRVRSWIRFADNFGVKRPYATAKDSVYLFFEDENVFQQFKSQASSDPQLNKFLRTLEENKQIRIDNVVDIRNKAEPSELDSMRLG